MTALATLTARVGDTITGQQIIDGKPYLYFGTVLKILNPRARSEYYMLRRNGRWATTDTIPGDEDPAEAPPTMKFRIAYLPD